MNVHFISGMSEDHIERMADHELRELIRGTDLPLQEMGNVARQLDQIERPALLRIVYQIRRQYQQRRDS